MIEAYFKNALYLKKKKRVVISPLIYLSALLRSETNFRDTQNFRQVTVSPDRK